MSRVAKKAATIGQLAASLKPEKKVIEKPEEDLDLDDSYEDDVFNVFFQNKV